MTAEQDRALAAGLRDALVAMEERLAEVKQASEDRDKDLRRYGKRNRAFIVVDVIVTIAATIATFVAISAVGQAQHAQVTVQQLHDSQIGACHIGNSLRAKEVRLWTHLAALSTPSPGQTKAQRREQEKKIAALLAYIRGTFPQLRCQNVYKLPSGK